MRNLLRSVVVVAALAVAPVAHATGGIQIDEQSATGLGMAGAQVAIADDPAAIFYNPAGLGFQPGLGLLGGFNLYYVRTHVAPDNIALNHASAAPIGYASLRVGRHLAFGVGSFANMGEHFEYPPNWRGRFVGYEVDVLTATIQPTLAIRIVPWLSVGAGLDIVPASFEIFRAINFGGGEGNVHVGANAVGVGGNVGLLLELIPHHLRLGMHYRSRVDLDFTGHGAISAPPEVRSMTGGLLSARTTIILPHNFSIGTGLILGHFVADAEVKVSIWRDLQALTVTLTDPAAPPGTPPITASQPLLLHNDWAIRGGVQYGFLPNERLRVRLGAGYDSTPLPTVTLDPLLPDTNRILVSGGLGWRWSWGSVDFGYMFVWLVRTTSTDPNLIATYQSMGHVFSLTGSLRLEKVMQGPHAPVYSTE
jgi:long-chain fatty acid transport protein